LAAGPVFPAAGDGVGGGGAGGAGGGVAPMNTNISKLNIKQQAMKDLPYFYCSA
jgi:hypothetical protein